MTKAIPYLLVKNGKKAIELYKDLFGAQLIEHQPFNKEIGKEFGIPWYTNLETMTQNQSPNGIIIAVPTNIHSKMAQKCVKKI